jgi:hypothetical protein
VVFENGDGRQPEAMDIKKNDFEISTGIRYTFSSPTGILSWQKKAIT